MSFSDRQVIQMRKAFASLASSTETKPDCPEPDQIWQAAIGNLPAAEIQDVVEHTCGCPSCAEDWRLACELAPEAKTSVTTLPARWTPRNTHWWLAAAASILLGLVSFALWRPQPLPGEPETYRTVDRSESIRSLVAERAILSRTDCELRWTPAPAAASGYSLLVSNESFEVLVKAEGLTEPSYRVPADILEKLPPGGKILWQVTATGPGNARLVSPTFVHRVE